MQHQRSVLRSAVGPCFTPGAKAFSNPTQRTLLLLPAFLAWLLIQSAPAAIPAATDTQTPRIGDHALRILSPNLLELFLVNTKQPDPAHVNTWDWVDRQQKFAPPDMSSLRVLVDCKTR